MLQIYSCMTTYTHITKTLFSNYLDFILVQLHVQLFLLYSLNIMTLFSHNFILNVMTLFLYFFILVLLPLYSDNI